MKPRPQTRQHDDFRDAMARFAGAVTAITTREDGQPSGLIATAVCSLSFEPPSLLACVNKSASAHDAIVRQGFFAVNLLSPELSHVVTRFTDKKGAERFSDGDWTSGVTGAPLLISAPVSFDCRLSDTHDGFSHSILVGVVEDVALADGDSHHTLLWQGRKYHRPMEIAEVVRRPAHEQIVLSELWL